MGIDMEPAVKQSLRERVKPPAGWLPLDGKDPLIQEAFRLALNGLS